MKRIISILTVICLLLAMLPLSAWAKTADSVKPVEIPARVNPLYAGILDQETLEAELAKLPDPVEPCGSEYVSEEEAVQQLRDQMKSRVSQPVIKVKSTNDDLNSLFWDIFDRALEHTGVPGEGDNLAWEYGGAGGGDVFDYYWSGGYVYYTISYQILYYTDAAQQAALNTAVDELVDQWAYLEGASDIEKVDTIYGYITANVTYDYEHLSDPEYMLMFTGYAALVNGTAVCQGYANLFYRLALELGVDNRIIVGVGWTGATWGSHAWNLTRIDDLYYFMDSTWDATYAQAGWPYQWYLLGSENFGLDHVHDPGYIDFLEEYPISVTDYADGGSLPGPGSDTQWPVTGSCGDDLTWSLTEEGVLTISGTGPMWDYPSDYPGWYRYVNKIRECVIEEGVTSIGIYPFYETYYLTRVEIPDSVTFIGEGAFAGCGMLNTVIMGSGIATIDLGAFAYCSGLKDVYYNGSQAQWEQVAIDETAGYNDYLLNANIHFTQGVCGDDLTWSLSADGVLTISGTGPMWDYPEEWPEWYAYVDLIRECVIEEGVTSVGTYAFYDCYNLTSVEIPVSVTTIGMFAFDECYELADVCYGGTREQWEQIAIGAYNDPLYNATLHYVEITVNYGDSTGDGTVNALDLILLRQYLAGWDVEVDPTGGDANGDGTTNALDLILLRQYLAGWDVTLGPKN